MRHGARTNERALTGCEWKMDVAFEESLKIESSPETERIWPRPMGAEVCLLP